MSKLACSVLAVFIALNVACAREDEDKDITTQGDGGITLPDYSDWEKTETTVIWHTKDGTTQGVLDVVLYGNTSQDGKRHTIRAFKHPNPNETIQFMWHEINDRKNKISNDYFFEKKEKDEDWLFVKDISNLGAKKLNDFLGKKYHFQF